jgi:hypothetical protein
MNVGFEVNQILRHRRRQANGLIILAVLILLSLPPFSTCDYMLAGLALSLIAHFLLVGNLGHSLPDEGQGCASIATFPCQGLPANAL